MAKELSEEEVEAVLSKAAFEIRRRKLEAPAILFIECHKPLAAIGGAASIAFAPFIIPFLGFDAVEKFTQVFSRRENVERLLTKLEQPQDPSVSAPEESCPTSL